MENQDYKLYNELAWIWKLWGDPTAEYAQYCQFMIETITRYSQREIVTMLNIACGGGKNLYNLKKRYVTTGLDLSPQMLKSAQELNPECTLVQADMRDFELNQKYDAIFIDDGISYMLCKEDLKKVFVQSFKHLLPGGVLFVTPDTTTETFIQNQTKIFHSLKDAKYPDVNIVYITNEFMPDPQKEICENTFIYLIRTKGELSIETDKHLLGVFPIQTWRDLLAGAGFQFSEVIYKDDEQQYVSFVCIK